MTYKNIFIESSFFFVVICFFVFDSLGFFELYGPFDPPRFIRKKLIIFYVK